jgi:hypothetical protein
MKVKAFRRAVNYEERIRESNKTSVKEYMKDETKKQRRRCVKTRREVGEV